MAKYEDYVKNLQKGEDNLEKGIEDAGERQEARETDNAGGWEGVPERFKGKSAEEIARSYAELEKAYSRQGNDLGQMRKLVDSLVDSNPSDTKPESEEELSPITIDDLYDNPNEAVSKAVSNHPALKRLDNIEKSLKEQQLEARKAAFVEKHGDFMDIVRTPEFQNWVMSDETRQDLFQRADQFDFGAADALLSLYKAETGLRRAKTDSDRERQLTNATLESSSAGENPAPKTFSRTEWLNKMVRAKQGNQEAEDYIKRMYPAYRKALAEGNVRD